MKKGKVSLQGGFFLCKIYFVVRQQQFTFVGMSNDTQKEVASVQSRIFPSTHKIISEDRGVIGYAAYIAIAVQEKRDRDQKKNSSSKKTKNGKTKSADSK